MNYRGDDLDLRTPQGRPSMAGEIADKPELPALFNGPRIRSTGPGRSDPIWVDDTVMTACNHAFELAKAHRASHVRLEHLLHALTTVDVAAEILEARGVRVAALRRETGALISGEVPVQMANGKSAPRRADEMEDLLRGASMRAGRRGVAASVDDVLDTLLEMRSDIAPVALLRRSSVRGQGEAQPAYVRSVQYVEPDAPRERVRMPAGSSYIDDPLRPGRADLTTTDSLQNSRIDTLEQMVRTLHNDLIGERKGFSAMLQDVQRQIAEQREDFSSQGHGLSTVQAIDRLKSIEIAIDGRLSALEQVVQAAKGEGARNWAGLSERLKAYDSALASRPLAADPAPMLMRLSALEQGMKSIEAALASWPASSIDTAPITTRLAGIEQALKDRLTETSLEIVQLADRLKVLEDGQAAQRTQSMQLSSAIAADIKDLSQRIAAGDGGERAQALIGERFQGMAIALDRQRSEIATLVSTTVGERINIAMDGRQGDLTRNFTAVSERINAMERSMTGYVQKFAESAAGYDQDIGEIQQAMLKLNANQQTLAGSLDQWRLDASGDLGVISNRVQSLERSMQNQQQLIEGLALKMDGLYRLTAERIEKRSRFWYWLFGTNSWLRASWPAAGKSPSLKTSHPAPPPAPTHRG